MQVNKNAKEAQKRKGKGAPANADASNAAPEPPRKWNDYTVHFEFPEPTELTPPLLQLIDARWEWLPVLWGSLVGEGGPP